MRIAESAAGWLRRRDPKAWLSLAIVVLIDDGHSHHVVPRVEAVNMLEKARAKAWWRPKPRTTPLSVGLSSR